MTCRGSSFFNNLPKSWVTSLRLLKGNSEFRRNDDLFRPSLTIRVFGLRWALPEPSFRPRCMQEAGRSQARGMPLGGPDPGSPTKQGQTFKRSHADVFGIRICAIFLEHRAQ